MKSMNHWSKCSVLIYWSEKRHSEGSPFLLRELEMEMEGNSGKEGDYMKYALSSTAKQQQVMCLRVSLSSTLIVWVKFNSQVK